MSRRLCLAALLTAGLPAQAQQPAPSGTSLAEAAAKRYPQPVRVGTLLQRQVLQPVESQNTLGWVRNIVKLSDGSLAAVIDYGGLFGLFSRPIAVPVDAMVLLGQYMEIVDFTPAQLDRFKTFDPAGTAPLPPDDVIRVGLARPSH
jgi:hypothetical protein